MLLALLFDRTDATQRFSMKRTPSRRKRSRRSPFRLLRTAGVVAALAVAAAAGLEPAQFQSLLPEVAKVIPGLKDDVPRPVALVGMVRPMPLCGSGKRISCVVDGDTFWVSGEKVRLEGIDAPEIKGACTYERDLARRATNRLSDILSRQQFTLRRSGTDRYGRTLARADTPHGEVGDILVNEGLARPWRGRREQWCG